MPSILSLAIGNHRRDFGDSQPAHRQALEASEAGIEGLSLTLDEHDQKETWKRDHQAGLVGDIDGAAKVVRRPVGFFRDKGPVPETAVLQMVSPPAFDGVKPESLDAVKERTLEREREVQRQAEQQGWRFLGVRRILAQSPFSRPSTAEPRRGLNPRVASRNKWQRIDALQRLKEFLNAYRVALKQFADGDREAVFPFGTYGMRIRFGALCSGP